MVTFLPASEGACPEAGAAATSAAATRPSGRAKGRAIKRIFLSCGWGSTGCPPHCIETGDCMNKATRRFATADVDESKTVKVTLEFRQPWHGEAGIPLRDRSDAGSDWLL